MKMKSLKNQNPKKKKQGARKFTLIEVLIIIAILAIIGNLIYHILHWREAVEGFKALGLIGSIVVIAAVVVIRKWIDSL